MSELITRTVTFKLYPSIEQSQTLDRYLRICCRVYNAAIEERKQVYQETGKGLTAYDQFKTLTQKRQSDAELHDVPVRFTRDAVRRVDHGFKAFFRRVKAGQKPGFPRFRPQQRYRSLEQLQAKVYLHGNCVFVPGLGLVRCRGVDQDVSGRQVLLRLVRKPSGWYVQIVFERTKLEPLSPTGRQVGVDVGLTHLAVLSTGEQIVNPRFARRTETKLRRLTKRVSRRKNGSNRRRKAVKQLAQYHERISAQRRDFAHTLSRRLVTDNDLIAVEKLNVKGLARTKLSKSILDAAWSIFFKYLSYKAVSAGRTVVEVDPKYTSQTCPRCQRVEKKTLSQRVHVCPCGCVLDRDHAAAIVILQRAQAPAAGVTAAESLVEGVATVPCRKTRCKSAR